MTAEAALRCPACGGELRTAGESLSCAGCGEAAPVKGGVPRFVPTEQYVGSFGYEWRRFRVQRPEEDEAVFRVKTGWTPEELKGKRVLDAGCGSGRYSAVAARWGAKVVSLDLSLAVETAAGVLAGTGAQVAQADLMRPPLAPGSFDFVFSIGVLHHSPDTRAAFESVARFVKPGGRMAVWVYRRNSWPQEALNNVLRAVTTRLPAGLLHRLCALPAFLAGIPGLNAALGRVVNLGCTHPDWEIRLCDAFDWYAPRYQFHHRPQEVEGWFRAAGFGDIRHLSPQKDGRFYRWVNDRGWLIGSGVNVSGRKI